jgi:hypothetical protein
MSLKNLIYNLDKSLTKNTNLKIITNIFNNYNDYDYDWIQYANNQPIGYEKKIIYKNDIYELILISWNINSSSRFHYHPENGCLMKVLSGELLEYKIIDSGVDFNIQKNKFLKGDLNILNGEDLHKIHSLDVSHSLHLYSPPNFYD